MPLGAGKAPRIKWMRFMYCENEPFQVCMFCKIDEATQSNAREAKTKAVALALEIEAKAKEIEETRAKRPRAMTPKEEEEKDKERLSTRRSLQQHELFNGLDRSACVFENVPLHNDRRR